MEEVIEILMKEKFSVYFFTDASHGYWAIPFKVKDWNKTGFLTPNGQWVYTRMGMGLKGAPHTYAQFSDLVFGPLPKTKDTRRQPTLIEQHNNTAFAVFMDDHSGAGEDFDNLFEFLHTQYFPRCVFGPVYLNGKKTVLFHDNLEMIGFEGNGKGIRPSAKHRDKILNWPTPGNRKEVNGFCWLTPFLRIFIPDRAIHVLRMKESYQERVIAEPKPKQPHDGEVEDCDRDMTKVTYPKKPRPTVQRKWVEKEKFEWTERQQESFKAVKIAIQNNACAASDLNLQFHVAVDASVEGVGGIVFQMRGAQAGTLAPSSFGPNERILMFLSFSLTDPESRYVNSERECLAIVRCLAEIRWLVMGSRHPVMIYTDHEALKGVFLKGETEKGRIANWMDRLEEYDFELHHKSSRDQHMAIADGLSRLPRRLTFVPIAEDSERIAMAAVETTALQSTLLPRPQTHPPPLEVMQPPGEEVGQGRDLGQPGTATREEDS